MVVTRHHLGLALLLALLYLIPEGHCQGYPVWTENLQGALNQRGVYENLPIGTRLGQLNVSHPRPVTFSTNSRYLRVDSRTGQVTLAANIDREVLSSFPVSFTARDEQGNSARVGYNVTVLDVNDNVPTFVGEVSRYEADVPQDAPIGTSIRGAREISVTDIDEGANADVRFACFVPDVSEGAKETCRLFDIRTLRRGNGRFTGVITLRSNLDYEEAKIYNMTFVAVDNGSPQRSAVGMVSIKVMGIPTSVPRFLNAPLTINILENVQRDTEVGELQVQDSNLGTRRRLRVRIVQGEDGLGWFRLGMPERSVQNRWYVVPIFSNGNLNREAFASIYKFDVEAIELSAENRETNAKARTTVSVNVRDYNDNSPEFNQRSYEINIPEGLPQMSVLPGLNMVVTDADLNNNAEFALQLMNDQWKTFSLSTTRCTGSCAISLAVQNPRALDYEEERYRRQVIEVVARETKTVEQRSSTATVTINLQDKNDNVPYFSQTRYAVSIREDRLPGYLVATIVASDADSGDFGTIRYRLVGSSGDQFNVNEVTGQIRLAKKLDFERQSMLEMQYEARDLGGKIARVPFSVSVLNFNEQGPVFRQEKYEVSLTESSSSFLLYILAEDREQSGAVTYRIVGGNTPDQAFQIDRTTGRLYLRRAVRFEESAGGVFRLVVEAADSGNPPQTTTIPVSISIGDVNNNPPQFTRPVYTASVSEIAFPGTSVVAVRATDQDSGENGRVTYQIHRGSFDNFVINSQSGLISVSQQASFDTRVSGSTYNMIVRAVDNGTPQRTGTAQVIVTVTDANNQMPQFLQNVYIASLMEGQRPGTSVLQIVANDLDTSSQLQYSIRQSTVVAKGNNGQNLPPRDQILYRNAFLVDRETGVVRTQTQLSRDKVGEISFVAEVRDTQAQSPSVQTATATVIVTIQSTVNNQLKFNPPWSEANPEISVTIPEEEDIGRIITTLRAIDPNTNQPIRNYQKVFGTDVMNYFRVDSETGQVTLNRRVDYETIPNKELSFQVRATSSGSPILTAVARVVVKVVDINDNSPKFQQNFYSITVPEGQQFQTEYRVFARDADSGAFGQVRYSLSGRGSHNFYLNPDTGSLSVANNASLDREQTAVYNMLVKASDNPGGLGGIRFTDVPLTVTVTDTNDNAPIFEQPVYNIERLETVRAGASLGQFVATDKDTRSNGEIRYILESGNEEDRFLLDPKTGVLTSRVDLQGSARDAPYVLRIRAQDRGTRPRSNVAIVNIFINDLQGNNEAPRISFPSADGQVINIKEGTPINAEVTTIKANARESSKAGNIQYRFLSNNNLEDQKYFKIHPFTGVITVNRPLDREVQQQYQLFVVVEDTLFNAESTRRFTINLTDINDNVPTFWNCLDQDNVNPLKVNVPEEKAVGEKVITVRGCDLDQAPNDKLYYYFVCGNEPFKNTSKVPFAIDKKTGVIKTQVVLDHEVTKSYLLCIKVSNDEQYDAKKVDPNTVLDWTIQKVLVLVTDVDDHGPVFKEGQTITTSVLEFAPFHTPVVTIRAFDRDSTSAYTKVFYAITATNFSRKDEEMKKTPRVFLIGSETGTVYTNLESYVEYRNGYFSMTVTATGANGKNATAKLVIYIVRSRQRLKFIFRLPPKDVSIQQKAFISDVNSKLTPVVMTADSLQFHVNEENDLEKASTDMCFHLVNDNRVLDSDEARELLDRKKKELDTTFVDYRVEGVELCQVVASTVTWSGFYGLWWLLIALTLLMILIALILICLLCYWYKRYRRDMGMYKPYVVVDPTLNFNYPDKEYEWQETTVKMD